MEARGPDVFRRGRSCTRQFRLACDPAGRPEFEPRVGTTAMGGWRAPVGCRQHHERDTPSAWMPRSRHRRLCP